ncbi:DUF1573 domain-containing protein [Bacteroidales bacterium OttesenSCG-928-L19]|nr:DUF1573 domain-containing protein [Bacteroidales bacterium OttesenSCG-928-L19]
MKRIIALMMMMIVVVSVFGQNNESKEEKPITGAEIEFEKLYFDFGEVKIGEVKEVTLTFTNIGKKPLILDEVISSCDCTEVTWTKSPVMPGQTGTITATYTAEDLGMISKRVTVFSNAASYKVVLQLKGKVI